MGHGKTTTTLIVPLRKVSLAGNLYARFPEVNSKLEELLGLPEGDRVARCEVTDEKDAGFVPSECLVYLVRAARNAPPTHEFERMYKLLLARVIQRLPRATFPAGTRVKEQNIQDAVLDRFVELLATDRSAYDERLDYFEMRFESALQRLRDSAFKMEGRRTKRLEPLSYSEDEEVSSEVEAAMAAADEAGLPNFDLSDDCRFVLEAAIDSLPLKERTVIHMMREGFPSNPSDSDKVSISKTLGMGERNVRYLRARAIAALRAAMEAGGCL